MSEAWVVSAMLAAGLMAQAWAQAQALREHTQQHMQWVALELALDLDARMRSHPQIRSRQQGALQGYEWPMTPLKLENDRASSAFDPSEPASTLTPLAWPASCLNQGCTGQELAQWDLHDWLNRAQQQLPEGWVQVQVSSLPTDGDGLEPQWTITVGWPGNEQGWSLQHDSL